jgi:DNA topoisomerase-3
MDLYICEKPAQGKDLAGVLGVRQYNDGYITGGDIAVTWGFGHLYEQLMPEDYDPRYEGYESWSDLSLLPFVPSSWGYKMKEKTAKQTKTVLGLIQKASTVYISTDFDREGEAIGRILLAQANYKGPIKRVCLTALDNQSIKKALANVKDGSETLPLFHAALARSRADFLVGMNLTRLYTALARSIGFREILNIGRVLTATVNLVCERERAIASFQPTPSGPFKPRSTRPRGASRPAETSADSRGCQRQMQSRGLCPWRGTGMQRCCCSDCSLGTKARVGDCPLLFDLTSLQQYANKRWGYTADEVLAIGQALYEKHKLLTYPRSDSRYLPQDQQGDVPDVLSAMVKTDPSIAGLVQLVDPERKCRVFNDSKVTSHHGIIHTFKPVQSTA